MNRTVPGHATTYRQAFSRYTISVVTFMEVVRGYQKKRPTRQLQNFLAAMASEEVIPFDQASGELAGRIAGELERIGQPIVYGFKRLSRWRPLENLGICRS